MSLVFYLLILRNFISRNTKTAFLIRPIKPTLDGLEKSKLLRLFFTVMIKAFRILRNWKKIFQFYNSLILLQFITYLLQSMFLSLMMTHEPEPKI